MEHDADSSTDHHAEHIHLQSREQARELVEKFLGHARRKIVFLAPTLYSDFFNTTQTASTLARFAAAHRNNVARFLVEDANSSLHDNARVVELCRRYTDFIKMRQLDEDDSGLQEMFLVVDETAYLHQPDVDRHEYRAAFAGRREARRLALRHERTWEHSLVIADILPIGL